MACYRHLDDREAIQMRTKQQVKERLLHYQLPKPSYIRRHPSSMLKS